MQRKKQENKIKKQTKVYQKQIQKKELVTNVGSVDATAETGCGIGCDGITIFEQRKRKRKMFLNKDSNFFTFNFSNRLLT